MNAPAAPQEREFAAETESVPAARRMVREALDAWGRDDIADSAALVVTELVTNAVLHARPPIRVSVEPVDEEAARIVVHDGSSVLPLRPRPDEGSTTGRGLGLVDSLVDRWGTEPTDRGKYVWVELRPGRDALAAAFAPFGEGLNGFAPGNGAAELLPGGDLEAADLESWADLLQDSAPERCTISLGDVPTDLLLAAKAHVDALVRELTLTASGAASGMTGALPEHLAALVRDVVEEFAEARLSIKRQALAAAARGDERTTLTLTLPASAADAGERYLAALEEADRYAQTARLLTLAAPPQHQVFRQWYVSCLVESLRAEAEGRPRPPTRTFESQLLRAVDVLAELQRASALTVRLHAAAQRLAAAAGLAQVAGAALDDAISELDASGGAVLLAEGRLLHPLAVEGTAATAYAEGVPTTSGLPAVRAHVTGQSVWVEGREERLELFPTAVFPTGPGPLGGLVALPLLVAGHSVGALELQFDESRLLGADERAFLTSLAAVLAQTLDRVRLDESRTRVVQRLTRLQAVTTALSRVRDLDAVLDVVVGHAIGLVGARTVSVSLLDPDGRTLRLVRVAPEVPAMREQWSTYAVDDPVPAAEALRTGEPVWAGSVKERDSRWPSLTATGLGSEHGLAVLPLHVEDTVLGALSLSFTAEGDEVDVPEPAWEFLLAFADACAQALERARTADRVERANRKLAFLADATDLLADTSDVTRTLRNVARVAVPEMADLCAIHLLEDGRLELAALEQVDRTRRDAAAQVAQRWPVTTADPCGIGRVVRDRVPLLIPDIPGALRRGEDAARLLLTRRDDPQHERAVHDLELESVLVAPLVARGRTLGAVTLASAQSHRHYGEEDLAFTLDLARRLAVGVDNARLFVALDAQTTGHSYNLAQAEPADRLARVLETMVDAFFRLDSDWRYTYVNSQAERLLLRRREELIGRSMWDAFPEARGTGFEEAYERAMRTGLPVSFEGYYGPLAAWVEVRANPDPDGLSVFVHRVDERKAMEVERQRANERLQTVAGASSRFAALLDPDQVLDVLVDVVVPEVGPYAVVALRADLAGALTGGRPGHAEEEVEVVRVRHRDREREEALLGFLRKTPLHVTDAYGVGAVTGTGRPEVLGEVGDEVRRALAHGDPEVLASLEALAPTSWYTVPLISRRRTLGAICVGESSQGELDRALLAELAGRAAVALDNALLYRAEWLKGIELQRQLLPRSVPRVPGVAVATRYLPSARGALTGGDFYEALEVEGGLLLALGDVMGHGMRSAARMGQLRAIVAALALQGLDPSTLLARMAADVDRMLDVGLATLLVGHYDQASRTLTVATAGHPSPLIAPAGAEASYAELEPGPPLGVPLAGATFPARTVSLPPGANLVLFSDGLVEERERSITAGLEDLRRAASGVDAGPDAMADRLLEATGRVRGGRDDVALLVLQHR